MYCVNFIYFISLYPVCANVMYRVLDVKPQTFNFERFFFHEIPLAQIQG